MTCRPDMVIGFNLPIPVPNTVYELSHLILTLTWLYVIVISPLKISIFRNIMFKYVVVQLKVEPWYEIIFSWPIYHYTYSYIYSFGQVFVVVMSNFSSEWQKI